MRILGIDPGLGTTGYGVIEDIDARPRTLRGMAGLPDRGAFKLIEAGTIKTLANTPIQSRIKKIFDSITEIIKEHEPHVLVLEKIYSHYKHPTTAILMGHARAAACLASGIHEIQLVNYPPTKIKKTITGNGHASKLQVQRMVQNILKLKEPPEPVDVSDALAMAISYCYMNGKYGIENSD
jgi:crossover junction endodeoxyribonuclease RuvC